ncbi:MAG: PIG-L family deacetylase, partial [Armatimonadetes bacterium]|nr:PIG-L family deacetylase [Armatimonadota bacterium]
MKGVHLLSGSKRARARVRGMVFGAGLAVAVLAGYSWLMFHFAWKRALAAEGFVDEMAAPGSRDRVLVVAPHPDDEVLGCGGLIQQAIEAGARVDVALVTNGDGSELSLIFGERDLPLGPDAYVKLGRMRQKETLAALGLLGVPENHVHFLGYPNNGLLALWRPEHWRYVDMYRSPYTKVSFSPYERCFTAQAPYCGQQLLSDLLALMYHIRPTVILAPHPQDVHPDHWVAYCFTRFALATARVRGDEWAQQARVYGYLIHWPRYPAPRGFAPGAALLPPAELVAAAGGWLKLPVTADQARAKALAVRRYRSQEPSFDRLLLSFARANEVFCVLPAVQGAYGGPVAWQDEANHRRGLGGADLLEVALAITTRGAVDVTCWRARGEIPARGYIAVDLRTWDPIGVPALLTIYVTKGSQVAVKTVGRHPPLHASKVHLASSRDGRFRLQGLVLPERTHEHGEVFFTCWGSVGDRRTDPAAAE